MNQWKKLLRSLGFTDSEAAIYLLSLQLGPSSVQDLSKHAQVSRVTTYTVIEKLLKDGLMSTLQKGKKQYFQAEAPERLLSFMNNKMKNMENTLQEMKSNIHELKLMQIGDKPVVKMYEGEESIAVVLEDVLRSKPKKIIEMYNLSDTRKYFNSETVKKHSDKLSEWKPINHVLYTASKDEPAIKIYNPGSKAHKLEGRDNDFHGHLIIYENKVILVSFESKPFSVIIESKNISDMLKVLFESHWSHINK